MKSKPVSAAKLERARQRLATVGSIAGLVSHQVRNRLATIRAALELLAEGLEGNLTAEYRAALLLEVDQVIADFNLGTDMLRGGVIVPAVVSAREMAAEAVKSFGTRAAKMGVELVLEAGGEADRVRADHRLLRLSLLNLLRNAAAAARDRKGGRVVLSIGGDASEVFWEVADNGPGLPEAVAEGLNREAAPGEVPAGLGLVVTQDAMLLMGGSIRHVTPRDETGARFRLSLPRAV